MVFGLLFPNSVNLISMVRLLINTSLSFVIIIGFLLFASCCSIDSPYSGGDGTRENPYLVSSKADLMEMASKTADYDKCFLMTSDIDFAGESFTNSLIAPDTDSSQSYHQGPWFSGVFDGGGHSIKNLIIDSRLYTFDAVGLFGKVGGAKDGASVCNLGLENCIICQNNDAMFAGGLFGCFGRGVIEKCHVTGTVEGGSVIGGMGGSVDDSQLRSCFTSCRVKGKKDVGGIIGKSTQSYLKECYSVGIVSGSVNVGGLCGHRKYGEFQESFFAGNVSGDDFSGGLIGYDIGWMMRNCYQWLWSGPVSGNGIALTEDEMVLQSSYSGFNFVNDCAKSGWILEAGFLPRLSWQEYQKSCLPRKCRIETSLSGEGTYSAPFLIMNKTDFLEFCTNRFLDRGYYVLESDMDLSNEVYETSLVNRSFGGFFNGNGHVISGVNIKPAGEQKDYIGIFSHVTAQVENLHIKGLTLDGVNSSFTGGLCGRCQAGTIKNCSVDCSVMADQKVGGICGELYYGRIKGCHVKGTVKGHSEVGGVCGKNNMGLIQSTKSSSNVYGDDCVGGICGANSGGGWNRSDSFGKITGCCAFGAVKGKWYVGGICGRDARGKFHKSYSCCSVKGGRHVGGFCGNINKTEKVDACFWDIQVSGIKKEGIGVGKTTAEMHDQLTYENAGWSFGKNTVVKLDSTEHLPDAFSEEAELKRKSKLSYGVERFENGIDGSEVIWKMEGYPVQVNKEGE